MRTVGTKLRAEVGEYTGPVKQAQRETRTLVDELADAARKGDLTASAIGTIGPTATKSLGVSERAAARLEDQIAETAREVQRLDRAFRETGDITLFGDLERQLGKLKGQLKAKDLFDRREVEETGTEIAEGLGVQIMGKIGPVMARMPLGGGAGGGIAAAIVAPFALFAASTIGAAVAGAVVGGAGIGGVAGGLALAAKDPRVKADAKVLGEEVMSMLGESSQAFVGPARASIATVRAELGTIRPYLNAIFAQSSELVEPLTRGVIGLVQEALPGVVALVDHARPVIDVIADRLPRIGEAVGDALEEISGDSQSAAAGVDLILEGLEGIIRAGGGVIAFFVDLFRVMVNVADAGQTVTDAVIGWHPLWSGPLEDSRARIDRLQAIINGAGDAARTTAEGVGTLRDAVGRTAEEVDRLKQAFDDLFGVEMALDEATIAYKQGMADLKAELVDGARTLDINTEAGRDNASAMLGQIGKINQLRESRIAHGESLDSANAKYQKDIEGLRRAAIAAGYNAAEVDRLIGKYKAIPGKVNTTVSANTSAANAAITGFAKRINTIDGRVITVYTRITSKGEYIPGQGTVPRRWGGVTEHAESGLLREAQIASPAAQRYGWAEPATGGEAFIPRLGDVERSRAIWAHVGQQWLGMRPAGGGATVVNVQLSAGVIGSRYELESWLAGAMDTLRRKGRI